MTVADLVFFDAEILSRVDKYQLINMNVLGREIQRSSNRSMKDVGSKLFKGKDPNQVPPSTPPTPPRARVGYFKKFNYRAYDLRTDELVVGPALLPGMRQRTPGPGMHERGLTAVVPAWGNVRVKFPKRPFMVPAMNRTLGRLNSGRIKLRSV